MNARTSPSMPASSGPSSPRSTHSMISRVAIGARRAMAAASVRASASVSPSVARRLTSPSARASGAVICVPRMSSSSALVRPISRGSRRVPPKPGMMPKIRLRLPDPRRLLHHTKVAGHRDLAAAARRVSLDRRDHGLGKPLDPPEQCLAPPQEGLQILYPAPERAREVRPTAEDAVAGSREDHGSHAVIPGELVDRRVELEDQLGRDRVRRRAVQRHHRVPVAAFQDQGLEGHGFVSSSQAATRTPSAPDARSSAIAAGESPSTSRSTSSVC